MLSGLTSFGKLLVGVGVSLILFVGGYFLFPYISKSIPSIGGNKADGVIGLNTWSPYGAFLLYNDGMFSTDSSRMYQDHGIRIEIKQMDDRKLCIESLLSDKVDAIYTTTDIMGTELDAMSALAKAEVVQFFKVDDSRGADVIVGTREYNSVDDLKSTTKIACAFPTASSTLLINWLDAGGKTIKDVEVIYVNNGIEAADLFKSGKVDLAVVWSPDDMDCIKSVQGSHVVTSTKYATSIIMDGLIAKKSRILENPELFEKIVRGWLTANADMQDPANREAAAVIFSKNFGFALDLVRDGMEKVRFSTYGDNVDFFGLNPNYTGVDGDDLYTRMSRIYSQIETPTGGTYAKNPVPWVKASYSGVIESITDMNTGKNVSEGDVKFAPSTKDDLVKPSMATKMVSINFATNSYTLDNESKTIIDREIGPIAKSWRGAKIRIEGNTDNTGNYNSNKELSYKRAESVMNYLIKEYGFDRNKFEVIGNGSDKPANGSTDIKSANSTESLRSANRRTDFGLIAQ